MGVKQSTIRIPQELFEAIQGFGKPFNEVRVRRREEALRVAAELREALRRRNARPVDSVEVVRSLRQRGRTDE